jgi:hypothetical protein
MNVTGTTNLNNTKINGTSYSIDLLGNMKTSGNLTTTGNLTGNSLFIDRICDTTGNNCIAPANISANSTITSTLNSDLDAVNTKLSNIAKALTSLAFSAGGVDGGTTIHTTTGCTTWSPPC